MKYYLLIYTDYIDQAKKMLKEQVSQFKIKNIDLKLEYFH